ncbi:unnamed protein product [Leuciscus chuanchicus]
MTTWDEIGLAYQADLLMDLGQGLGLQMQSWSSALLQILPSISRRREKHFSLMPRILSRLFGTAVESSGRKRNARAEVSSSIHVSLSGALFLLNISFMLSEWAATLRMEGFCVFIAVMIHYSLLSCFTWMAVEALHLYLLLIRVFNIYIKHYMTKLSLIGWGDCWIKVPLVLYGVNLSYFTVIFLFNLVVLLKVSRQIFKLKQVEKKKHMIPVKDAGTVLGLMCLLGTTWGLVFLGSGYTNYIILYLFCISNTMQGASIFLWMCLTMRPNKQKAAHTKSLSTVDTFTIEKQKE